MKYIKYILFASVLITACNSKNEHSEMVQKQEPNKNIIEFTDEQFKVTGIELGNIEQKKLKSVVKASGYLAVPPQNKANVSTFIGAVIKQIFVLEGDYVKKGQTLAILEHPDFIKLQQEYLATKSNLSFLEKEYQRQKELFEQNATAGKIFQKIEADYNTEKGKLSSLESQLRLISVNLDELSKGKITSQTALAAPINGYIGRITANIGMFAEPIKPLFEIIDNTKIHCDLLIYEKDLFKVKVGQKVHFLLANLTEHQNEHTAKTIEGEIFGINKSFENDTKALMVHALIKNENHELIPGMFVNASIEVGEELTSVLPTEAVVKSGGKEYIFILSDTNEPNTSAFKMVEVITGVSDLGYTEVTLFEKIPPGIKVAVKNSFFILSKAKQGESGEE